MKIITQDSRLDAGDSFFLTTELESLDPADYYEIVPSRLGRRFFPPVDGVAPYDTVYKYAMTRLRGRAKRTGPKSKDAPMVSVVKTEHTQAIETFEDAFGWTVDEIKAARAKNLSLDTDSFKAAVVGLEQSVDGSIALGNTDASIFGALNNDNVDDITSIGKTGGGGWLSAGVLPKEIIADVAKMLSEIRASLKQATVPGVQVPVFQRFTLLLPTDYLTKIATTPRSDTSDTTILDYILTNFRRWLAAVEDWWQLDEADNGAAMAVMYPALDSGALNPLCGGAILPMDYEQLAPQESGRNVTIPAAAKAGGVVNRYPMAWRYMRGEGFSQ
jgi:hypothetical protein